MENNFIQMAALTGQAVAYTYSNGVKSQLQGGQTTSALRLIMRSSKTGHKTSSIASAVAPSFWNQMLLISSSLIFVNKNSVNVAR